MLGVSHTHFEGRPKSAARLLAAAVAAIVSVAGWGWWTSFEERALQSMPALERARIYTRNLDSMRMLCGTADTARAFEDRCRDQALFLAGFPECEADCRALIEPHLPRPTR